MSPSMSSQSRMRQIARREPDRDPEEKEHKCLVSNCLCLIKGHLVHSPSVTSTHSHCAEGGSTSRNKYICLTLSAASSSSEVESGLLKEVRTNKGGGGRVKLCSTTTNAVERGGPGTGNLMRAKACKMEPALSTKSVKYASQKHWGGTTTPPSYPWEPEGRFPPL